MTETVFFDENNVKVTNARFISNGQTYAMSGVTSVRSTMAPAEIKGYLIAIGIGLIMLFALDGAAKLLGIVVAGVAVWLLMNAKSTHWVTLVTAAAESRALESNDEAFINRVVEALNDAIVHRG
jgi:hypothetical protein